jgi:hypothetical protein
MNYNVQPWILNDVPDDAPNMPDMPKHEIEKKKKNDQKPKKDMYGDDGVNPLGDVMHPLIQEELVKKRSAEMQRQQYTNTRNNMNQHNSGQGQTKVEIVNIKPKITDGSMFIFWIDEAEKDFVGDLTVTESIVGLPLRTNITVVEVYDYRNEDEYNKCFMQVEAIKATQETFPKGRYIMCIGTYFGGIEKMDELLNFSTPK